MSSIEYAWRLLPSERLQWHGKATAGVARGALWRGGAVLLWTLATIAWLFTFLLAGQQMPGVAQLGMLASYLTLFAIGTSLAPRVLHDRIEYVVTDRRVIMRWGKLSRWIDRTSITYGRIIWNPGSPGVGDVELVRAVPFGPLARKQKLRLRNVRNPVHVFGLIRGANPGRFADDPDLPLSERLDEGEQLLWGGGPTGLAIDWREWLTGLAGLCVLALGARQGWLLSALVARLEQQGLPVGSLDWSLLFAACALATGVMLAVGAALLWHGLWRARSVGSRTEYLLTSKRVLIRRGRVELSLHRRSVVDVAVVPALGGKRHLFLILDAPDARALEDSGAMTPIPPAREVVPPVLYELGECDALRNLLLERGPANDRQVEHVA